MTRAPFSTLPLLAAIFFSVLPTLFPGVVTVLALLAIGEEETAVGTWFSITPC